MAEPRVAIHVGQLLQRVPGGIGRYVEEVTQALSARGVPLVPFAAGPPPDAFATDSYVDLGRPTGRLRYEMWHRLRRRILDLDADVIHAPSLAIPPTGDRPLVVTVHDLAFIRMPHYFTVRGIRFHERGLALARKDAAAIVVPSRFVADELVGEGFAASRIHVARHGINPVAERDDGDVTQVLNRLGVVEPYALFVGTLEPRKGIGTLLDGFARLRRSHPEVTLVLVGARGWGRLPNLDRPGVQALGALPDDDLDALYRGATMLAYPSHYEGFGLPLLEAMVRGCPVVTSDATSLPEVVGGAGVTVPVDDADALGDALRAVLEDHDRRDALIAAGRARALEFTWDSSADAHLAAYHAAADA